MIDFTKPIVNGLGQKVQILTQTRKGNWPIVGLVGDDEDIREWTANGKYHSENTLSLSDLQNMKIIRYMNLFVNTHNLYYGDKLHETEELAMEAGAGFHGYIRTIRIEI
jgi:hypothetical protein